MGVTAWFRSLARCENGGSIVEHVGVSGLALLVTGWIIVTISAQRFTIGHNTVRPAASVAGGWAGAFAGAWAGAKVGAALGGLPGSVIPVLGSAAEAAIRVGYLEDSLAESLAAFSGPGLASPQRML